MMTHSLSLLQMINRFKTEIWRPETIRRLAERIMMPIGTDPNYANQFRASVLTKSLNFIPFLLTA